MAEDLTSRAVEIGTDPDWGAHRTSAGAQRAGGWRCRPPRRCQAHGSDQARRTPCPSLKNQRIQPRSRSRGGVRSPPRVRIKTCVAGLAATIWRVSVAPSPSGRWKSIIATSGAVSDTISSAARPWRRFRRLRRPPRGPANGRRLSANNLLVICNHDAYPIFDTTMWSCSFGQRRVEN